MNVRRQFIAGAKCPKCQAIDRIRQCRDQVTGDEWIECVSCHYRERKPEENEAERTVVQWKAASSPEKP